VDSRVTGCRVQVNSAGRQRACGYETEGSVAIEGVHNPFAEVVVIYPRTQANGTLPSPAEETAEQAIGITRRPCQRPPGRKILIVPGPVAWLAVGRTA